MSTQPAWVDQYIKSIHNAFVGMVPSRWGSVDFWEESKLFNGAVIARLHEAVVKLKAASRTPLEVAHTFSNPSTMRSMLYFLACEYQLSNPKNKQQFKEVVEYLVAALAAWVPEDTFATVANKPHTSSEVETFLESFPFQPSEVATARELGRLYNTCASLAFALYRDMFPQEAHEVYGPYDASSAYGPGAILVIKHFPKIRPVALWPKTESFAYEDVRIYQIYKGVSFKCDWIGMHSRYEGDLMNGLHAWAVEANGKFVTDIVDVKTIRTALEQDTLKQMASYDGMTSNDWLLLALRWDCWQFNKFFALAGMDWEPTDEMKATIKGGKATIGFGIESFPSLEDYANDPNYEAYWLKDLYRD